MDINTCIHTVYSGTPFNGHPSMADTYDNIMDNSEYQDRISIDFNSSKSSTVDTPLAIPYTVDSLNNGYFGTYNVGVCRGVLVKPPPTQFKLM